MTTGEGRDKYTPVLRHVFFFFSTNLLDMWLHDYEAYRSVSFDRLWADWEPMAHFLHLVGRDEDI